MHTSSEPEKDKPSEDNNDVSIYDAETQSGNEHSPNDNDNDNDMFMLMLNQTMI